MVVVTSFPEILASGRRFLIVLYCAEKEFISDMKNVLSVFDRARDVVRDHDDRDAFVIELFDEGIHLARNEGVKACDRLI